MNVVIPDQGLVKFLQRMAVGDFHYHLFKNNFTPDKNTVVGDFVDCDVAGYARITVAAIDFATPVVVGHLAAMIAPMIVFSAAGPATQNVYGYYVTGTGDAECHAFAIFDAGPLVLTNLGIAVIPILGQQSRFG